VGQFSIGDPGQFCTGGYNGSDIAGTLCFILLVGIAVYVTLDLNLPERGLIRVSQEPIQRLLSSMPK
jgi:hypothetical protein